MADIRLTEAADLYQQDREKRSERSTVFGLGGDDTIRLYSGIAVGSKGNDTLEALSIPGEGLSVDVAYWDSPQGVRVDLLEGWASDGWGSTDKLIGRFLAIHATHHNDWVRGTTNDETVYLFGGADTFIGGGGTDTVAIADFWLSGSQRFYKYDELDINVSADGRKATVNTKAGLDPSIPPIRYVLEDVTYLRFSDVGWKYLFTLRLADLISPTLVAQQTVAAIQAPTATTAAIDLRLDTGKALGSPQVIRYHFLTDVASNPYASWQGFRAFSDSEQSLVRAIFQMTSAQTGLSFKEVFDANDPDIQLRFGVSQQSDAKGMTSAPKVLGQPTRFQRDVLMDVESMVSVSQGSEGFEALLHEIGHALGLRHLRNSDAADQWLIQAPLRYDSQALSVMASADSSGQANLYRETWGALDWAALQFLYGSKPSSDTDNVYVLDAGWFNAKRTLLDAQGSDWIDASLSPIGVFIDLSGEEASSVGMSRQGFASAQNLSFGLGTVIEHAVGTPKDDVLLGNEAANRFLPLAGNDWIDGGEGIDEVVLQAKAQEFILTFDPQGLLLAAANGVDGLKSLRSIELLRFADRLIDLQPRAHSDYSDLPDTLYQFFVVGFGAAPGVHYMEQMAQAYRYWLPEVRLALEGGSASAGLPSDPPSAQAISLTVQRIVEAFTTKTQFTSVYPQALYRQEGEAYFRYSHDLSQAGSPMVRGAAVSKALFDEHMASLAKALVEGIVKTSASEATKLAASADIQAALGLGSDWSIGKVIYTVFGNLAAKPLSDPTWGGTAKQFANQVAVAKYYTDHLSLSQDDVGVLRAIMAPVNHLSDVSSPEAMASLIGIGLLADPGG
jgi:hypothetical protein